MNYPSTTKVEKKEEIDTGMLFVTGGMAAVAWAVSACVFLHLSKEEKIAESQRTNQKIPKIPSSETAQE